jgi:hypothetical protein
MISASGSNLILTTTTLPITMTLFLVRAMGCFCKFEYIQKALNKECAANTCRSTYAKVISVKVATSDDLERHGVKA